MTSLQTLVFYATPEHDCSYLDDRLATTLFVDPKARITSDLYSRLTHLGFRRSGSHYYRPRCNHCNACVSVRVLAAQFKPTRSQKRTWQRNQDLIATAVPVAFYPEHYALYERYINERHPDGDMYPPSRDQFQNFLLDARPETRLIEFRLPDDTLVGVSVTDRLSDGLSAIYTFFHPDHDSRSLGVFAVLHQIEQCKALNLPYLYLGYWIRGCRKMSYKTNYRPMEILLRDRWLVI
ncbi:MAG: arginyltransferase [Hahellaceae bacterium]|nr:arginyltransferase [Hahellaceae bacterium]